MGDSPASDADSSKPSPTSDERPEPVNNASAQNTSTLQDRHRHALPQDRRPFGSLEFQVSEVVERLEASVNAQDAAEEERKPEMRKISTGPWMEPDETTMDDILKILEDLVIKTDPHCENMDPPLLPTDAVTRAAILSHSISALFGRLERGHAARLGAHVAAETTRWISHMFRLGDYQAYYHQEHMEGLVKVTRMLLHHKYPRYLEDGALAFVNRLPCIYSCVASPLNVVQHLCRQLGLPLACVRPVPVHPKGRGMDIDALTRLCDEDIAANRTPLLVLCEAGVPPLGCGADVARAARAAAARGVHLHLRGHALALPAAMHTEDLFDVADSLTMTPGQWFGVPGLPAVTFYRIPEPITVNDLAKGVNPPSSRENALAALAGLSGGNARLPAFPLWACVLAAGAKRLQGRIAVAFKAARAAYAVLSAARLKILSARPGGDEPPNVAIVEAISLASACVTFQFAPSIDTEKPPPYYDKLNSWLGQVLQREANMINIEVCETESHGVVLRYCPLEGGTAESSALEAWASALEAQLHVLHATVALREPFRRAVRASPTLRLVHLPGWAGLGGVRYVPPGWDEASQVELNSLNENLVETLKSTDNAFSCGDGEDGIACVRFGMVTADTDIEELLELVIAAGKEVEETSEALNNMTEVLKKGIEAAQADLERENAERVWQEGLLRRVPVEGRLVLYRGIEAAQADLERENAERVWQEGLLRRVPVVGRVVQWWAPAPHAPPPPGRRLHLALGTLQTTADVYRNVQKNKSSESESDSQATPHQTSQSDSQ